MVAKPFINLTSSLCVGFFSNQFDKTWIPRVFFMIVTFIVTNYNYKQLASLAKAVAFTYPIFLLLTIIYLIRWYENIHWNNGNCSKLTRKVMLINTYSLSSQCSSRCFIVFNRGYILFRLPDNFVLTQLIDTEWVNFVSLL